MYCLSRIFLLAIMSFILLTSEKVPAIDFPSPNPGIKNHPEEPLLSDNPAKSREEIPLHFTPLAGNKSNPLYNIKTFSELKKQVDFLLSTNATFFQEQPLLHLVLESVIPLSAREGEELFKIISYIISQRKDSLHTEDRQASQSLLKIIGELDFIKVTGEWYGKITKLLLENRILATASPKEKKDFVRDFLSIMTTINSLFWKLLQKRE